MTLRLVLPDPERATRRRAALVWLRGLQRDGRRYRDVINASEVIVCLHLGTRPTDAAVEWLRARAKRADVMQRRWAGEALEQLGVEE